MASRCDADDCNQVSSSESAQEEKGNKNKRKFFTGNSSDVPDNQPPSSLTEFPRYEVLQEKLRNGYFNFGLSSGHSNQPKVEEAKEYMLADWNDPMACQLEEFLCQSLHELFRNAIKKIVECGYSEEVAERAILRTGFSPGSKDPLSNTVDGALTFFRKVNGLDISRHNLFDDLQSLVQYTMIEMVNMFREVKPSFTLVEAMWSLFICESDMSKAVKMKGFDDKEKEESSSHFTIPKFKLEARTAEKISSNPDKPSDLDPPKSRSDMFNVKLPATGGKTVSIDGGTITQATFLEDSSRVARDSRRDILRKRTLQMEKNRGRFAKGGTFKAELTSWAGLSVEKKQKPAFDSSSPPTKNGPVTLSFKETVSKPIPPKTESPASSKIPNYYAGIPYDKSKGKYVAKNEKDKMLLKLISKKEGLERDLQRWTDWTNETIMQATRRIGKEQPELKALRQEKVEAGKIRSENQLFEENAMKRVSEMEHAVCHAAGQIDTASSTISNLEIQNLVMKNQAEAEKSHAMKSAVESKKAVLGEQETLKKVQAIEPEKRLMLEELKSFKDKSAGLLEDLEKKNNIYKQYEDLRKQEEKETGKIVAQANSIKNETRRLEERGKEDDDKVKQKAENDLQNVKDNIKELETEISKLRLESESSQIAALRRGVNWSSGSSPTQNKMYLIPNSKRLTVFREIAEAGSVKPERECVMCMTEEISVIFLPCAHQVLCEDCNVVHEKQGMKECPSCRTPIERRLASRYDR